MTIWKSNSTVLLLAPFAAAISSGGDQSGYACSVTNIYSLNNTSHLT